MDTQQVIGAILPHVAEKETKGFVFLGDIAPKEGLPEEGVTELVTTYQDGKDDVETLACMLYVAANNDVVFHNALLFSADFIKREEEESKEGKK